MLTILLKRIGIAGKENPSCCLFGTQDQSLIGLQNDVVDCWFEEAFLSPELHSNKKILMKVSQSFQEHFVFWWNGFLFLLIFLVFRLDYFIGVVACHKHFFVIPEELNFVLLMHFLLLFVFELKIFMKQALLNLISLIASLWAIFITVLKK